MKASPLFAVLLSALLLQGCVAAAVVGVAGVATKTTTDPRTVGTQVDDGTLEARVSNAISKDKQLKDEARIVATAYQGNPYRQAGLYGHCINGHLDHHQSPFADPDQRLGEIFQCESDH